jgi:amino acid adenylation domain-containing protein
MAQLSAPEISMLVGAEREWSAPEGVPGLVRASARRTPDAVALVDENGTLTYRQLEAESDALCTRLLAAGGRPGAIVAVCLPRGRALVVALLAAAKAHMPYLPLATDDPQARRDLLLGLSGAEFALVTAETEKLVAAPFVLTVDLGTAPAAAEWSALSPYRGDEPVYVLFTSGTTGTPKGVVVGSDALVNRLLWAQEAFRIGPDDRILQKTPSTFDVSGWEFWNPLFAGATMILLAPGAHVDPDQVARAITDHAVTLCHFVPSMLTEFLSWPGTDRCRSLRAVLSSGEELTPGHVRQFHARLPGVELVNLYGPTEAAIDVTWWTAPVDDTFDRTLIGAPIANCTLVVVNEDYGPTPPGEVGELAIGGPPLAAGYLGEPELTRRFFIDAPAWAPVPRLYLTGDLVRLTPDGLEYLGRRDSQVKIRGQRVELTAVEDALRGLPAIADAVATTVDRGAGAELCAFVVPASGTGPVDDLRATLSEDLPASNVPTLFWTVDAIARSASGKVDRRSARERAAALTSATATDDDPARDLPARLWFEATGAYPGGDDVGFLDAGGHSLTAVRLVGLVDSRYGVRLPLLELLHHGMSLDGLRAWLAGTSPRTPGGDTPDERSGVALSSQQHGLWVWSRLFPDCPAYNVTAVLRLDRSVNQLRLENAVAAVVRRHPALRTTFHDDATEVRRRVHPTADTVLMHPDRVLDHQFRPDRLPRIAVGARPGIDGDTLLFAIDHLVADQRTLDLVLHEVAAGYAGTPMTGEAPAEVVTTDPHQRAQDLAWWAERLRGTPAALTLPWQRPRSVVPSYRGGSLDLTLDAAATRKVDAYCADHRVTPFIVALAAFARRLAGWAGIEDLVVGVPMTGRETPTEQDAVGFFVRTLPVRVRVVAGEPFDDLVRAVAEALFESADHASVSFEEIVERVGGARDLAHNPVFRVWCNDLSRADPPAAFGEATATPVPEPARWSLFDLGLYLHREPGGSLRLRLVHSTDLWEPEVAGAFVEQCAADLTGAGAGSRPDAAPLPAPVGSRTYADLVEAVLAHSAATPARPAVDDLDYAALGRRIRQVSAAVREHAVAVLLARRHADLAPAVLGCWHAGVAPLLIDAEAPARWRDDVLASTGPAVVVELGASGPGGGDTLRLTGQWWRTAPETAAAPVRPGPGAVGHVLLTSGTTGRPAMVRLPADALPAVLDGYRAALQIGERDVFALTVPPDHDPVFRDLLLPLTIGATVRVPAPGPYHALPPFLTETAVTVLHLTPGQASLLIAAGAGRQLRSLRRVVFHGDLLRYATVDAIRGLAPGAEIYNLYGTTETPQAGSLRLIPPTESGDPAQVVPIAAAAPHRRLLVAGLHSEDEVGVLGEVVVTGHGLTLEQPGRYRTGDLGRVRPDGLIDLAGRADRQVSVRGHRVQIDSVETVIRGLSGVEDCHVAVDGDGLRLTAWWTGTGDLSLTRLRAELPPEALPGRIFRVASLPLTSRGKPDTAALAAAVAEPAPPQVADPGGEPLAGLILRRLAEQQPGLHLGPADDFFEAGLTSLGLLRLYESVRAEVGDTVALADFFRFRSARELSGFAMARARASHGPVKPVPVRSRPDLADQNTERNLRRALRRATATQPGEGS